MKNCQEHDAELSGTAAKSSSGRIASRFLVAFTTALIAISVIIIDTESAMANSKYAGIVIDVKTGKTLYADNADRLRYPASLTKIMTLYMVFTELEKGRLSLNTRMKVSSRAAGMPPSKIGFKAGETVRVKDAIRALVTKSANDVAVVVAEHIGGTESGFAKRMTSMARKLGMRKTTFRNASGLPNSGQRTTARDMARLGIAIQDKFPRYFKYFSTKSFKYRGRTYRNHNRLLGNVRGVDGIKTGYIRASGFNLVTSVNHGGRRIVAVVMGGRTGKSRDAHMRDLISRYFNKASRAERTSPLLAIPNSPLPKSRAVALASAGSGASVPLIKPDEITTASVTNTLTADDIEFGSADDYNSNDLPAGWQIQIGALPSEEAAGILLSSAIGVGSNHLVGKVPFTEPVIKGEQTLHRARFAGFADKHAAREACSFLKTKDFACLALQ